MKKMHEEVFEEIFDLLDTEIEPEEFMETVKDIIYERCPVVDDKCFKSQEEAEVYCAENGIDFDWIE